MELLTKNQVEDKWGPANAITPSQILNMLELGNVGGNDIFYDLGSGHGRVVRIAVTKGRVKKAIGIEVDEDRFCMSRNIAKRELSRRQLRKVDYWLGYLQDYKLSDATVVYEGHYEVKDEVNTYKKILGKRRVKIIKRDLPLISYLPISVNRTSRNCWFFLMKYPLHRHKTRSKNKWASYVLGRNNVTIRDVYDYYDKQMKKEGMRPSERRRDLNRVKKLVRERF